MKFPKMIQSFMLHNVSTACVFKGKPLYSAHYMKIGSYMNLLIHSKADKNGEQSFSIEIKGSVIENMQSLEEAIEIAEELLIENNMFMG
ncbi:MAG: hypothetical protein HQK75_02890 [Candidatus Magnetomorum sp.]|nr:hypothetical protein [Candidatus Magnetomorum sp.]